MTLGGQQRQPVEQQVCSARGRRRRRRGVCFAGHASRVEFAREPSGEHRGGQRVEVDLTRETRIQ